MREDKLRRIEGGSSRGAQISGRRGEDTGLPPPRPSIDHLGVHMTRVKKKGGGRGWEKRTIKRMDYAREIESLYPGRLAPNIADFNV